jgi:hypothetical protein
MAEQQSPPGIPRWVKILAVAAVALVIVMVGLHLAGISPGGPGSHSPNTEHSTTQP